MLTKRQINKASELKFTVASVVSTSTTTPVLASLTDIAQGTGDEQRVGDSITPASLRMKYSIYRDPSNTNILDYVRIFVFQWFPNSSNLAPTAAQLFLLDPTTATVNYRSFWTIDNLAKGAAQFRVLYDKCHLLSGRATEYWNTSQAQIYDLTVSLAPARKHIQFLAGSSTSGAGKIYIGNMSNTTAGSSPTNFWYATEFRFRDL
jgi:hypothetical protein